MAKTNSDIYQLAAEELGLVGVETLDADTRDKIQRRADLTRAWLIEEGLVYWIDDAIPDAAALPYAQIVAGQCAELFGRGSGSPTPYAGGEAGFRQLERHVSQRSAREPVVANYF